MGWLLVMLVLPAAAPVGIALAIWSVAWDGDRPKAHPMLMVKDGQLFWTALAFCGAALYELHESKWDSGYMYGALIALLALSALWGAIGAMKTTPFPAPSPDQLRLYQASKWMTGLSAVMTAIVHFRPEIACLFNKISKLLGFG